MWILIYTLYTLLVIIIGIGISKSSFISSLIDEQTPTLPLKTIAVNESDIDEVLSNLTKDEKVKRLMNIYPLDYVLHVLGYHTPHEQKTVLDIRIQMHIDWIYKTSTNHKIIYERIAMNYGIENEYLKKAIAMNKVL